MKIFLAISCLVSAKGVLGGYGTKELDVDYSKHKDAFRTARNFRISSRKLRQVERPVTPTEEVGPSNYAYTTGNDGYYQTGTYDSGNSASYSYGYYPCESTQTQTYYNGYSAPYYYGYYPCASTQPETYYNGYSSPYSYPCYYPCASTYAQPEPPNRSNKEPKLPKKPAFEPTIKYPGLSAQQIIENIKSDMKQMVSSNVDHDTRRKFVRKLLLEYHQDKLRHDPKFCEEITGYVLKARSWFLV